MKLEARNLGSLYEAATLLFWWPIQSNCVCVYARARARAMWPGLQEPQMHTVFLWHII